MRARHTAAASGAWLLLGITLGTAPAAQVGLSAASAAAVRARVLPTAAELSWQNVRWRDSLASAVLEGDQIGRPVLLWAMNGHPLGCT